MINGTELKAPKRKNARSFFLLVVILAVIPYLQALNFGFVADDHIYLGLGNRDFWQLNWDSLWQLLVKPANPWEFLPVRDFSYWIDMKIGGDDAASFHAGNLFWYGVSCYAVFWTSREIFFWSKPELGEDGEWLAMLVAAIFAWHPTHVEAVAWISGRKDLLAGVFSIFAQGMIFRAQRSNRYIEWLAASVVFLLAACFSKGAALGIVLVCIICGFAGIRTAETGLRKWMIGYTQIISALLLFAAGVHWIVGRNTAIRIENSPGALEMIERASRILSCLLKLLIYPKDLRVIHDVYSIGDWHWVLGLGGAALLFCALIEIFREKGSRIFGVAALNFLVPCIIYLQIIPFSTWSMASERFVFVQVFGGGLLIAYAANKFLRGWERGGFFLAVFMFFVPIVFWRVPDWKAEKELWVREAKVNPVYFNSVRQYAQNLAQQGRKGEGFAVISRISRSDARYVLWLYFEFKGLDYDDAGRRIGGENIDSFMFCAKGIKVLNVIAREKLKIALEKDVPYINFLRNIEKDVNPADRLVRFCGSAV